MRKKTASRKYRKEQERKYRTCAYGGDPLKKRFFLAPFGEAFDNGDFVIRVDEVYVYFFNIELPYINPKCQIGNMLNSLDGTIASVDWTKSQIKRTAKFANSVCEVSYEFYKDLITEAVAKLEEVEDKLEECIMNVLPMESTMDANLLDPFNVNKYVKPVMMLGGQRGIEGFNRPLFYSYNPSETAQFVAWEDCKKSKDDVITK